MITLNNHIFSAMIDEYGNLVTIISTSQGGSVKLFLKKSKNNMRIRIHERVGDSGNFDIEVVEEDEP